MEVRRIYVKHPSYSNELQHSGKLGMKWGIRRWQNEDGSLTPEGRIHYGVGPARGEKVDRKYTSTDGTLNLRGKIKYLTLNKYASLSDEEIQEKTRRLQSEKNLEDLKKQTSDAYRIKRKLEGAAEEVAVAGFKKGIEKLVNHFVDKSVSKILNTDKDKVKAVREFTEKYVGKKAKEINEQIKNEQAFDNAYAKRFGEKPPKDFEYPDFTKKDESNESQVKEEKNKPDSKQKTEAPKSSENKQPSQQKAEEPKSSENKKEEKQKLDSSEISKIKSKASKGESIKEIAEDTGHSTSTIEKYVNKKVPAMKEVKDNYNEKSSSMKEVSSNPLTRHRMVNEEISGKPYLRIRRVNEETKRELEEAKKKKGK